MKRTAKAASKKGFTLIELVVVVAIIGVLAGLAPAYRAMAIKPIEAIRDE